MAGASIPPLGGVGETLVVKNPLCWSLGGELRVTVPFSGPPFPCVCAGVMKKPMCQVEMTTFGREVVTSQDAAGSFGS